MVVPHSMQLLLTCLEHHCVQVESDSAMMPMLLPMCDVGLPQSQQSTMPGLSDMANMSSTTDMSSMGATADMCSTNSTSAAGLNVPGMSGMSSTSMMGFQMPAMADKSFPGMQDDWPGPEGCKLVELSRIIFHTVLAVAYDTLMPLIHCLSTQFQQGSCHAGKLG